MEVSRKNSKPYIPYTTKIRKETPKKTTEI